MSVKLVIPNFLASISIPKRDTAPPGSMDTDAKTEILPTSLSCSNASFTFSGNNPMAMLQQFFPSPSIRTP